MAVSRKRTVLGGILIFCGVLTLIVSVGRAQAAIRNILELNCIFDYLGLLVAAAFGTIGLSGTVAGMIILRRAQG